MRMVHDRILVEIIKPEQKTASGLYVPLKPTNKGIVLLTGPRCQYIKVGDIIRHFPHAGASVEFDGKDCLILKEDGEVDLIFDSNGDIS